MSQYILINRIRVQNANAIAGFTWGFPAITHFMGFAHGLSIKLKNSHFIGFSISGCAVISHEHQTHTYGGYEKLFTQTKNPGAMQLEKNKAGRNPSVIEEGKMNITVSLLIGFDGFLGNQTDVFIKWVRKQCRLQRLAGGTILDISSIQVFNLDDKNKYFLLKRMLLPGFVLMDRSEDLAQHYEQNLTDKPDSEFIDAWLNFAALKQKARPKSNLITLHLKAQVKNGVIDESLVADWITHLEEIPFNRNIPESIARYFEAAEEDKSNKLLLEQWYNYLQPTDTSPADWEYLPKQSAGYLVPIMTGYKAISAVYDNKDVANTRDCETPVCFVESVHSVGEWRGVNNLRDADAIASCLWHYDYEENWYLCKQGSSINRLDTGGEVTNKPTTDNYNLI